MTHLLIIRFSAMGDVAMTVPIIDSLARQNPQLKITVVSRKAFKAFYDHCPSNVNFYGADFTNRHKGAKGIIRLYKDLKALNIDTVADLHKMIRSVALDLFFFFSGIKVKLIKKGSFEKMTLTRKHNKVFKQLPTSFERYTNVFKRFNLNIEPSFTSIFSNCEPHPKGLPQNITETLNSNQQNKLIGIAPFAKHKGKIYPIEKMEQVISELSKNENIKLFLFGGGQTEIEHLSQWENKFANTISLAGKIKLENELAIINQLDLMLSMDSANMHMASIVGCPTISIWGATHPNAGFMGWKQIQDSTIQVELECRPCSIFGQKPCHKGNYPCMHLIEPDFILNKIYKLLDFKS